MDGWTGRCSVLYWKMLETRSSNLTMHKNTGTGVKKKGSRRNYLHRKDVVVLEMMTWPPRIPDLNTTECIQDYIKRWNDLRKPTSTKDLGLDLTFGTVPSEPVSLQELMLS